MNIEPLDKSISISEWAEKYRYLPKKISHDAGRWQNSRTPYLVEIMDCLSKNSPYREVCFMRGTQVGGTSVGENFIGYTMHNFPSSIITILPNSNLAKHFHIHNLNSLISNCDDSLYTLWSELTQRNDRSIIISDAKHNLKLHSSQNVFFKECDSFPIDFLIDNRILDLSVTPKYHDIKKIYYVSTPTIDGASVISELLERSDKRFYNVPCPFCSEFQTLEFEYLKYDTEKTVLNQDDIKLECKHCKGLIDESHKTKMLQNGKWIKTFPESNIAGFHLNALYSPLRWLSWSTIVNEYLHALRMDDKEKMKHVYNLYFAKTWKQ